jgi:sulfatase maturation enzyme AslB (radical SAM superfamily)
MNKEIAKKIIDEFFTFFDDIENIQFFGGEPLIK